MDEEFEEFAAEFTAAKEAWEALVERGDSLGFLEQDYDDRLPFLLSPAEKRQRELARLELIEQRRLRHEANIAAAFAAAAPPVTPYPSI